MKKLLLAAVATAAVASPAAARDGSAYIGAELGATWPRDSDADVAVDYTSLNVGAVPPGGVVPEPADFTDHNAIRLNTKMGYDIGLIGGYDFGMFRL